MTVIALDFSLKSEVLLLTGVPHGACNKTILHRPACTLTATRHGPHGYLNSGNDNTRVVSYPAPVGMYPNRVRLATPCYVTCFFFF